VLVIWAFLLISEEAFSRGGGDAEGALQGHFSVAAYGEVSLWILAFPGLVRLSLKAPPLSPLHVFRAVQMALDIRASLPAVRGLLATTTVLRSVAFKLCLVISVLGMCSRLIEMRTIY